MNHDEPSILQRAAHRLGYKVEEGNQPEWMLGASELVIVTDEYAALGAILGEALSMARSEETNIDEQLAGLAIKVQRTGGIRIVCAATKFVAELRVVWGKGPCELADGVDSLDADDPLWENLRPMLLADGVISADDTIQDECWVVLINATEEDLDNFGGPGLIGSLAGPEVW